MAQFQVPQFIETESKIVGPLTLRQFIYLAVAGLLAFFLFFVLKTAIWFVVVTILGLTAASFAFIKYNGRPLTSLLTSAVSYMWKPRFYTWQRMETTSEIAIKLPEVKQTPVSRIKTAWLKIQTGSQAAPQPRPTPKEPILHGFHEEHAKGSSVQVLGRIAEEKAKKEKP